MTRKALFMDQNFRFIKRFLRSRYKHLDIKPVNPRKIERFSKKSGGTLFSIDYISNSTPHENKIQYDISGYSEYIKIKGWIIDDPNKTVPDIVCFKINNIILRTQYPYAREDVATILKNKDYKNCGFEIEFPHILLNEGRNLFSLIALSKKTSSYYETHNLVINYCIINDESDSLFSSELTRNEYLKLVREIRAKDLLINKMHASFTWQLTSPIRKIFDFFSISAAIFSGGNLKAAFMLYKEKGKKAFMQDVRLFWKYRSFHNNKKTREKSEYELYVQANQIDEPKRLALTEAVSSMSYKPKVSIVVPVFNIDPVWLDKTVNSVKAQIYENWELCIYDDASSKNETIKYLKSVENTDHRIKIRYGKKNGHISYASNKAIEMAEGEYIAFLDHDDEISVDALCETVSLINEHHDADVIYCDEDKISTDGKFSGPYFKPDFNYDLILSNNYMCHFLVVKKEFGDQTGWLRRGYEGAQDHDLILRLIQLNPKIYHIPKVLYHWRQLPGSTANQHYEKSYANDAGKKALEDFLHQKNIVGSVEFGHWAGSYRVKRHIIEKELVSIIIPFKDKVHLLKKCVESILEKTNYKNYELILINNNSEFDKTYKYLNTLNRKEIKIIDYKEEFNFSKINNYGVTKAEGKYILLLNNDIEVIEPEWLDAMVEHIQRPEVGVVGAKLLFPNNTIQHAGIVLGINGCAGHFFKGFPGDGYFHFTMGVIKNVSAVTGACLMTKKELFLELGGLDGDNFRIAFNDVDYCLKVRDKDLLITYTPYALLYHHESASRGYETTPDKRQRFEQERLNLYNKWSEVIDNDPYYNPNLTRTKEDYSLK